MTAGAYLELCERLIAVAVLISCCEHLARPAVLGDTGLAGWPVGRLSRRWKTGPWSGPLDAVLVLTDGGPANATRTMVYHIWEEAFVFLEMGYAAAVAWVLFFIVFLVTLVQWKLQGRWVHYEA